MAGGGRELIVVWAGRHQRDAWEMLCRRYRRRITRFRAVRDVPVRAGTRGGERERQDSEGQAMLAALPERCWTIALDRRGAPATSPQLSARLTKLNDEWPYAVAFLIGSDLGLPPAVLGSSRERLSLGPLTLPHELARLVLYEQLYRALSMAAGIKYHREPL